jgi:SNF2 family DNA or RNA helicase
MGIEQGLGKTVQIIALLSILFEKERTFPFLVVVPNSTIGNWIVCLPRIRVMPVMPR